MILKFGARNFYSFKEGIEISLELGAKCPESISKGKSVTNLLCVKGANGSGKTNALKILAFFKQFCCDSFNNKPENEIMIEPFFHNDDPVDIFCDFIINDTKYNYELSLTSKKVISEKLSRRVRRFSTIFERKENDLIFYLNEFKDLKNIKQRSNASLISSAHQYEITNIKPIYSFFELITNNVSWFGRPIFSEDYKSMTKYYKDNPSVFKFAIEIIKQFDLGISNITINEIKDEDGSVYNYPLFEHDAKVKDKWLIFHSQSLGTKTLYNTIPYYLYALTNGGVLVMDEFDTDFHPHILPKLLSFFDNETLNVKNAQLIFSTHNTDILEYMGKYRTVFINKESSESYGYRLDEIPGDIIRNDRLIAPVYNSGKIGGVPKI